MPVILGVTRSTSLFTDNDGDAIADPGDVLRHVITISNTGDQAATNVFLNETENGYTINLGSVKIGPITTDDNLGSVTGNTPFSFTSGQLTGNDLDPDDVTPALKITHINGTPVVDGLGNPINVTVNVTNGTVESELDGTFTFRPAVGFEGAASFTYQVQDEQGLGSVQAGAVSITVTDPVWYIDSTGGNDVTGNGTFENPFASLVPLSTGGSADALDDNGDIIFVYANGANAYNSGIVLELGQVLRGEGVAADFIVNGITVSSVATDTQIEYTTFGVTLATGNTILGIDFVGEANGAVAIVDGGATVGSLTISDTEVSGIGQIIDIDNGGALTVGLESASSTGSTGANGGVIDLQGVTGTFGVSGTTSITGTHGQTGINIGGAGTGLASSFAGQTTVNVGANNGVALNANTGSTSFAGLDVTVTNGNGVFALGAGTLTITGSDNDIQTGTGAIVSISNTTVGDGNIAFDSLSATGTVTSAPAVIDLNNLNGGNGGADVDVSINSVSIVSANVDGINVRGASSADVSIGTASINAVIGDGIELNGHTGSFTLSGGSIGNTDDPSGDGVNITGGTGAVSIAATITKTTAGNVVEVNNHETGNVTFSGNLSATGDVNNGILVTNSNSGTIAFTGQTIALTTGALAGVTLTGNTGGTINFAPTAGGNGLDITTTSGVGFTATGGGTISVTGAGNSISSSQATALNVVSTTIGASGLNFVRIDSGNNTAAADPVNGIVLNGTGAGGLTISGTGTAGSGGTIQFTTGDGIVLNNASNVNLTNIIITNVNGYGINADNLGGTSSLTNSTIAEYGLAGGNIHDGFSVLNVNTNLTSLILTGNTFNGNTLANDGFFIEAQGTSNVNVKLETNSFTDMRGDSIEVQQIAGSTGTLNAKILTNTITAPVAGLGNGGIQLDFTGGTQFIDVNGNIFTGVMQQVNTLGAIGVTVGGTGNPQTDLTIRNNDINSVVGGKGITVFADGGDLDLMIQNNTIDGLGSTSKQAIEVIAGPGPTVAGNVDVTIQNNSIGQAGALWTSGNGSVEAIFLAADGAGQMRALVSGNVIDANGNVEIVRGRANGGTMHINFTNNDVDDTATTSIAELAVTAGTSAALPGGTIFSNFTGNVIGAGGVIRLTEGVNGVPDVNNTAASAAAIAAANGGVTVTASAGVDFGQAAPTAPATPTLPASPLFAEVPAAPTGDEGKGSGSTGGEMAADNPTPANPSGSGDSADPAPTAGEPAPSHPVIADDNVLTQAELDYLVEAAIQRWAAAGASAEQVAAMRATAFSVADMTGTYLGASSPGEVRIDSDGAGHGWFVDRTPGEDSEYSGGGSRLVAEAGGAAAGRMDLLTVIMHELGHQAGLDDLYGSAQAAELMYGYAFLGERRLPETGDLAGADPSHVGHTSYVILPPTIATLPAGRSVIVQYDSTVTNFNHQIIGTPFTNSSAVDADTVAPVQSSNELLTVDTLTLGDLVYIDANGNSIFDAGDSGVNGVTVSLFVDADNNDVPDTPGTPLATTTTAGGGVYTFTSLAPGNYIVRIDAANFGGGGPLAGRISSPGSPDPDNGDPDANNDDNGFDSAGAVFSNAITLAYNTEPTAGTGNDTNNTLDFGFIVAPDAQNDAFTTDEDTTVAGQNVFADNGSGADTGTLTVTAVNGSGANVGVQFTLPSGALLTLNADGTFTYDPNNAFDPTPTPGTGASNTPDSDSFTYTVTGGDTATVTITINGLDSNDLILGTAGADILTADTGSDTLQGLDGNDRYFINANDVVNEVAGQGFDRILTSATHTLAAGSEVEMVTTDNNFGLAAIDLTGNELANYLFGNAAANTLNGAGGADVLLGLGGNDTYHVESAGDRVVEFAGEGNDQVLAAADFTLEAGSHVETIKTNNDAGTSAINLKGNAFAQSLTGNAGANTLDGGGGGDTMTGLGGNDRYIVRDAADTVVEAGGAGIDRVLAAVSYTLSGGADIEILSTIDNIGTAAIDLDGNGLGQYLFGNEGANTLNGGGGQDVMIGFGGADIFELTSAPGAANRVRINDFQPGVDKIALDDAVFTALAPGALSAGAFRTGPTSTDADDRIIYDSVTGGLKYDPDGAGGAVPILFASLQPGLALTANDFQVI